MNKKNAPFYDNVTIQAPRRNNPSKKSRQLLWGIPVILVLCCITSLGIMWGINRFSNNYTTNMVILFNNLADGDQVQAGTPIMVHISAASDRKIQALELWANGERIAENRSPMEGGTSPMPLVTAWQPSQTGEYVLTARAFDQYGNWDYAQISISATALTTEINDDDNDGIDNDRDACPSESGIGPDGCPGEVMVDLDGDSITDDLDDCPSIPGTDLAEGCPDRDHDGLPDDGDVCPDEPGVIGSPGGDGCPASSDGDRDGDGVLDAEDLCPDEPGPPFNTGCPPPDFVPGGDPPLPDDPIPGDPADTDGDGVMDDEDVCPEEPGSVENSGCPSAPDDRDHDSVPDALDLCPEEPGTAEDGGCPAPGLEGDEDGDGIPDGEEDDDGFLELLPSFEFLFSFRFIEFQALDFEVADDYEEVYCYYQLNQMPLERTENFDASGIRHWDINAELGSRVINVTGNDPVTLIFECFGIKENLGLQETHFLGTYQGSHPESDWDGHVIEATATGEGVDAFRGTYRLCDGSCDNATFPIPYLSTRNIGGIPHLIWSWRGDYSDIDGFKVYINETHQFTADIHENFTSIADYQPICGMNFDFTVTAFSGDRESPHSNIVTLEGEPCPRTVMITFNHLITGDLGDEHRHSTLGPIFGSFWAQGSTSESLSFSGNDYPDGVMLHDNTNTTVARLFSEINSHSGTLCSPGHCGDYHAPAGQNWVIVEVGPNDDLSIGGVIYDQDWRVYQQAFFVNHTYSYDEIIPGEYILTDGPIQVSYVIDMLVGEESESSLPDLNITAVTTHDPSGQFRIQVQNLGASFFNQDVLVRVYDTDDGDLLLEETWEGLTMESGSTKWLQHSTAAIIPYGITVQIDPDNSFPESNDDNNVFVTPVLVRVQLTNLWVGTPCESFLSTDSEHWFYFIVSSGPDINHSTYSSGLLRYPASGIVRLNTQHREENDSWDPADEDARFTVEIPVKWNEKLFISVVGYERDAFTDDPMGYVRVEYSAAENFGARDGVYHQQSIGPSVDHCDDGITPLGWDYFGFTPTWRITRIR